MRYLCNCCGSGFDEGHEIEIEGAQRVLYCNDCFGQSFQVMADPENVVTLEDSKDLEQFKRIDNG